MNIPRSGDDSVREAEVIQVIRIVSLVRGGGTVGDPSRLRTEYWSLEGEPLAMRDPYLEEQERQRL